MVKCFRLLVVTILIFYFTFSVASAGSQIPPEQLLTKKATVTLTGLPSGAQAYVDLDKHTAMSATYPSRDIRLSLNPGTHTLKVQAWGHQPWSQTITVSSGERKTIQVNLITVPRQQVTSNVGPATTKPVLPPSGSLTINVSPNTAKVTVDDREPTIIPTGSSRFVLGTGTHTIHVTATGYLSKTERIQISNGDASYLSISLDKDPKYVEPVTLASLEVTSHPTGASVYVDGQPIGATPYTITAPVGPHTVTLRAEGYQDRMETVDIRKTSSRTNQKIFWILTPDDVQTPSPQPAGTESVMRPSPSTTLTRANAQSDEPTDVLQYVIYFFRGLLGGNQ